MIKNFYSRWVTRYPLATLIFTSLIIGILGFYATKLEIDASSETLLIETDSDLAFSREVSQKYYSPNFLILTFSPKEGELIDDANLNIIKKISEDLLKIDAIESITSILNVPLVQSPLLPLTDLAGGVDSLSTKKFDKTLVKNEFLTSEFYSNNLVSSDFSTTAIVLNLKNDERYTKYLEARNLLLEKSKEGTLSKKEKIQLQEITQKFKSYRDQTRVKEAKDITSIRAVMQQYELQCSMFLGGVNMIATDIIGFVKNDLIIYGASLLLILMIILWILFKRILWVFVPIIICSASVLATAGLLGYFGWEVTVISSNFIALQLIITLSIVIHLIVRYREIEGNSHNKISQKELIIETMDSKFNPTFFAVITTVAGFGSLVLSSIKPVQNLGFMMSAGVAISLVIAFLLFPTILMLRPRKKEKHSFIRHSKFSFVDFAANIILKDKGAIFITSIIVVIFSITGASQLIVENSFINYFKKDTAIYQGMEVIDEELGGTTPLDIIIKFENKQNIQSNENQGDDFFDDFEEEFAKSADDPQYWFSQDKMETILNVHNYLDSIPEIGKVQSLGSLLKTGKLLNHEEDLDGITLALFYKMFPERYKDLLLRPYINIEANEARISTRIIDSNPNLRRNDLIKKIETDLRNIIKNPATTYRLSNLMILYNNMLQSLFDSQIKTLGFVIGILFIMFLLLFKSLKVAFIALVANIVPISLIFGIMGWVGIPLDVMTITIAAISIGIGVDDTIHYIHRYKEEYDKTGDYLQAMLNSHKSVGYAMLFTSLIIMIGFSVLIFSNLIPTIYFGFLTVIIMFALLCAAILLLPRMLIGLKPYS
jgi:predicted RND superfamily exporter protein